MEFNQKFRHHHSQATAEHNVGLIIKMIYTNTHTHIQTNAHTPTFSGHATTMTSKTASTVMIKWMKSSSLSDQKKNGILEP